MDQNEIQKKKEKIAVEILNIARSSLLVNMRFLSAALIKLELEPYQGTISTDGEKVYFDPDHIIELYKSGKEETVRAYLHLLLHCLFRHPFSLADRRFWNLACDIAVEAIISEWGLPCTNVNLGQKRRECVEKIKSETQFLTAEKIYSYLKSETIFERTLQAWEELFRCDDHSDWGVSVTLSINVPSAGTSRNQSGQGSGNESENAEGQDRADGASGEKAKNAEDSSAEATAQEWRELAERLQTDLETFSTEWGNKSGSMVMSLKEVNREKYDYENFLKKFAVLNEAMKINDDEFDYVFYTLGLNLYGNLPLVEPLEYKDVKKIKEFVIAIDTSGSVAGEKVQAFVRKTYNILKQQESFGRKINLHIVQCDAKVQNDTKITSLDDLETYFSDMKLYGFGGTDFRPVFAYVDELIEKKEFINLKGLIYFTDGCGTFPERKPPYETAFVFVDDNYNNYDVPSWAIKLILESKDI